MANNSLGTIEIENMQFFAYHGCFEQEKVVGNNFRVDLWLNTDCSKAAETDDINDALDYQHAYNLVKDEMRIPSNLLEHVCRRILDALYASFGNQILSAKVKVSKMTPPMGGQIENVSVTLKR